MLQKILLVLVALLVVMVAVIATRPATYTVTRSATIDAPPSVVFDVVNSFERWNDWSPWDQRDPAMKRTYGGARSGVGATYAWVGNDQVGEGRMTIVESVPNEKVGIKLEFLKPFPSVNDTTFTFAPAGAGTTVTWTMVGNLDFMGKAMGLFLSWDRMIGPDFEQGLANMKRAAEKDLATKRAADEDAAKKAADEAAKQDAAAPTPTP